MPAACRLHASSTSGSVRLLCKTCCLRLKTSAAPTPQPSHITQTGDVSKIWKRYVSTLIENEHGAISWGMMGGGAPVQPCPPPFPIGKLRAFRWVVDRCALLKSPAMQPLSKPDAIAVGTVSVVMVLTFHCDASGQVVFAQFGPGGCGALLGSWLHSTSLPPPSPQLATVTTLLGKSYALDTITPPLPVAFECNDKYHHRLSARQRADKRRRGGSLLIVIALMCLPHPPYFPSLCRQREGGMARQRESERAREREDVRARQRIPPVPEL